MAGAFTYLDVEREYDIDLVMKEFGANYNVAPSQQVPVIVAGSRILNMFKWGFIPSWSKDGKYPQINARSETLLEKPFFKNAFINTRCVVVCSGFFEWDKKNKVPYYIGMKNDELISLAGIYSIWKNPKTEKEEATFTIITTKPNKMLSKIHDRMPVILNKRDIDMWIDKENKDGEQLMKMLKSYDAERMKIYQVSKYVNSPKNNDESVLNPVS